MSDDLEKRLRAGAGILSNLDYKMLGASVIEAADALAAKDARIAELKDTLKGEREHIATAEARIAELEKALELPTEAYLAQLEDLGGKGTVDPLTADDDELFIFDLVLIQPLIDAIRRARTALGGQHDQ